MQEKDLKKRFQKNEKQIEIFWLKKKKIKKTIQKKLRKDWKIIFKTFLMSEEESPKILISPH